MVVLTRLSNAMLFVGYATKILDLLELGETMKKPEKDSEMQKKRKRLYNIDPEDKEVLKGKHPNYIRGWNRVKHGIQ